MKKILAVMLAACILCLCVSCGEVENLDPGLSRLTGKIGGSVTSNGEGGFKISFVDVGNVRYGFIWANDIEITVGDKAEIPDCMDIEEVINYAELEFIFIAQETGVPENYEPDFTTENAVYHELKKITVLDFDYDRWEGSLAYKPVIYLYPEETTDITVKLHYDGVLTTTYPKYNDGWSVTAQPDGTLTNHADGREYSYLFWEGMSDTQYDMSKGFVVKGEDTMVFLQDTLSAMGLTPREYNEMIVFWLPQMEFNDYNLITFQQEAYTEGAVLEIDPEPDSVLRVFMAWTALDEPIDIEPQEIEPFEREGFTVVEWGGTEVK